MTFRTWFSRLFRFLASMAVGLLLLGLVAVASVAGSAYPAWGEAVYGSPWFATLWVALGLNTGFCTVQQFLPALRGSLRKKVLFFVHGSVLVLAVGCLWGTVAFRSASVSVRPGETFLVGGETWSLERAGIERYPDGSVSDWVSTLGTPRGSVLVRVNQPAQAGDLKVLLTGSAQEFTVRLETKGRTNTSNLVQDTELPLTADGRLGLALTQTLHLLLLSEGKILFETPVTLGNRVDLGSTGLAVTVLSSRALSTFLVRDTPGLWLVWAGFGLLAVSVTLLMLLPRSSPGVRHA